MHGRARSSQSNGSKHNLSVGKLLGGAVDSGTAALDFRMVAERKVGYRCGGRYGEWRRSRANSRGNLRIRADRHTEALEVGGEPFQPIGPIPSVADVV